VGNILGRWAAIIGAVVLAFIGFQMLRKGLEDDDKASKEGARTRIAGQKAETSKGLSGWAAIAVLALSVSVDALAVGFGLGTTRVSIVYTVITMGTVAV
jgi:putative Mn2+ efflux pump MntP